MRAAADHIADASFSADDSDPAPPPAAGPAATGRCSPRKLAANRANAARSTGPRTDAGKARAAGNAVRHGLTAQASVLPGEDPDELDALARGLEADLRPIGAAERELVGRVVSLGWRLRRVARAEAAIWEADDADRQRSHGISSHLRETFGYPLMPGASAEPPAPATGPQFVARQFACPDASALERLAAYEQRLDRALHAALRQFQQLRKMRGEREDREGEEEIAVGAAAAAAEAAQQTDEPPARNEANPIPVAPASVRASRDTAPEDPGTHGDAVAAENAGVQNEATAVAGEPMQVWRETGDDAALARPHPGNNAETAPADRRRSNPQNEPTAGSDHPPGIRDLPGSDRHGVPPNLAGY